MAIIFTYPPIAAADLSGSDRLLLSHMRDPNNPTKSLTLANLRTFLGAVIPGTVVIGTGTTDRVTKWVNGAARQIGDSSINDDGSEVVVDVDFRVDGNNTDIESSKLNMTQGGIDLLDPINTAKGITFINPNGLNSGIVNMYYSGSGALARFIISRNTTGGAEIELEADGDVNINRTGNGNFLVGGEVTLDDYGSGTITGTPTFNLEVDANGKIIETAGGGGGIGGTGTINTIPKFTAATTIGDSIISENGNRIDITGELTVSQLPVDFGGSTYLFEAGQAEFSAELDMQGNKIVDLAGPVLGTDAVNKNYVDTEVTAVKTALGYKSVQVFQWPNGTPVAYTNWTNGVASNIPFNATPLVETGTYSGTAANFAWTCVNNAGGTATQEAQFTLGANGAGTWQIDTCQHWFDQTNQVEIRVSFQFTSGGVTQQIDVIDEKSTELSGDKIFYGSLVREFVATDKIEVEVEFVSGGVNPFPSDSGNRPIEITFTKLV